MSPISSSYLATLISRSSASILCLSSPWKKVTMPRIELCSRTKCDAGSRDDMARCKMQKEISV